MKRVLIGGFLSLIGSIWSLAIIIIVGNNLVSSWATPPGRFLTTVMDLDLGIPISIAFLFLLLGLLIMGIEYFREDN
ncbi:MAG: hypothetical protein GX974_09120 [Clostridiales bacterium]|nr:hypothetical protein [Clostridiales bacterium]